MDLGIFLVLILLQFKHWYVDFVNQTNEEIQYKGEYLDWRGMKHSAKHGIATLAILWWFIAAPWAVILAALDFVVHYHIDWFKMNFGNKDISTPAFWNHLGLDQMAHQLVYLLIAYICITL